MMLGQENQDCMGQPCISVLPLGEGVYQAIAGHCSQSIPRGGYDGGSLYSLLTVGGLHPTAADPSEFVPAIQQDFGDEQLQLSLCVSLHRPSTIGRCDAKKFACDTKELRHG